LSGLGLKGYWDYQEIVWRLQYKQNVAVAESNVAVVQQQLESHIGATVTEVESLVGLTSSFNWMMKFDGRWHSFWTSLPNHNLVARFTFNDDRLSKVEVRPDMQGLRNGPTHRIGRLHSMLFTIANGLTLREWQRFGLVIFVLWGLILVAYGLVPARRGWLAWWLIAVSLLFGLLILMPSRVPVTVGEFLDHESLLFSSFMLLISLTVCTVGGVRNRDVDLLVCRKCGYDLRGNQSGACPECGRALTPAQKRAV